MFSDDRFMTMATGLVLAIVVGTLAQKSDTLMAFFTGDEVTAAQDDQFTVRAGKNQTLDVLANDTGAGALAIVKAPSCGAVQINEEGGVEYLDSGSCSGKVTFTYSIEGEDGPQESVVSLSVISDAVPQETVVAAVVPEEERVFTGIDDQEYLDDQGYDDQGYDDEVLDTDYIDIEVDPVANENTQVASPRDDRLTPGQILLQDDSADIEVVGFGAARAPTLFAPDMQELIQPQETVDTLRRSVAAVAPSQIDADENISRQSSAAMPSTGGLTRAQPSNLELGTELSPSVAFNSPSQPRLMPAPQLLPVADAGTAIVIEHGPTVTSIAPTSIAILDNSTASEPVSLSDEIEYQIATLLSEENALADHDPLSPPENVDTQSADAGDVRINAADPADSSDIVVEMAAQILLPSAQLTQSLIRNDQATPDADLLQSDTDTLFVADLIVSAPPVEETLVEEPVAEETLIASLPTETTEATQTFQSFLEATSGAQSTTLACDIEMTAAARPGASISLTISSECRNEQIFTVEHSGLAFSERLDSNGKLSITLPALANTAVINIEFEDGGKAQSSVLVRDASDIERIAVVWSVPVSIELHAFEDGALEGASGHVWNGHARRYRDTLTGGGGFMESLGDPKIIGGSMAQIYSLPTNRLRKQTTVRMDLRITDAVGYCEQNMVLRTIRTESRGGATPREFNLAMPNCSSASAGLVLENFVEAISVARR
ncbi:MAG: Ig-like domain-containing protein [Paracoccaceae bacterium]